MHRREPMGHQCRARAEQFGERLLVAIEQIVGSGLLRLVGRYDPAAVVVCLTSNSNAELEASEPRPKQGEIGGDAGCNVYPLLSGCGGGHRIQLIRRGMLDDMRAVRLGVLGNQRFLPGPPVVPVIRRRLATYAR
jgi:hypothetical protein